MQIPSGQNLRRFRDAARRNALGITAIVIASSGTAVAATSLPERVSGSGPWHTVEKRDLAPGAVGSGKLVTDSVRGRAVKESTLDSTVLQRRVNGACLAGETIRQINQDGSVLCQVDAAGASGTAGGDLTGSYPNPQIAGGAVGAGEVADGSLTGADLAPDSLGGREVDESMLSRALLVISGDIAGSLADAQIAAGSVGSAEVADGSLTGADVGADALGGTQVNEGSLAPGGDLTGTLANAQIGPRSVGSAEIGLLPAGRALQTTQQTLSGPAESRVQLDSAPLVQGVTFDDANDQFVITTPGVYSVTAQLNWLANSAGIRALVLRGGTGELAIDTRAAVNGYATVQGVSTTQAFTAGQTIYLTGIQSTGGSLGTDVGPGASSPYGASLTLSYQGPISGQAGRGDDPSPTQQPLRDLHSG